MMTTQQIEVKRVQHVTLVRSWALVASAFLFSFTTSAFFASKVQAGTTASAAKSGSKKLSTNVNFDDMIVDGKYQYSNEALTTVENEKDLDDLLGVRLHFKDRLEKSIERR
jgi:hypothetical protein